MALTNTSSGKGSGSGRLGVSVTSSDMAGRAGRPPPRTRQSHNLTLPTQHSPAAPTVGAAAEASKSRQTRDSSSRETSSGSEDENCSRDSDAGDEAAMGYDDAGMASQLQVMEGQQPARGVKRSRQHAQHTQLAIPMPPYPNVALERRAVHHIRAQQYALRCALGLPVDIPYSAWGSLQQLKQQAIAAGITHIPEKVLLSYQPRAARLRLIPKDAQLQLQPVAATGSAKQNGSRAGYDLSQAELPANDTQQVPLKTQAAADGSAISAEYNTGHRDMQRLVLGAARRAQTNGVRPPSAHYKGLVQDIWVDLSSVGQLAVNYASLTAQQHGPTGQWLTLKHCLKAVHAALLVVALGEHDSASAARDAQALIQVAQRLAQNGVTHVPLMCIAAVMYKQPGTSLASSRIRDLAWNAWWPPAGLSPSRPGPDHTEEEPGVENGSGRPESQHGGVNEHRETGELKAGAQHVAAEYTTSMKAAGLQVMAVAEACVYLQHLKAGTRLSWAKPSSNAVSDLDHALIDHLGVGDAEPVDALFSKGQVFLASGAGADNKEQQAGIAGKGATAELTAQQPRWVAALPSNMAMPAQHQPRPISIEAASMMQHLQVPTTLLKGPPTSMCVVSDRCVTRDDAVQVLDTAMDALAAHMQHQQLGCLRSSDGHSASGQNTAPLSGQQLSKVLAMLRTCPTTHVHTQQQAEAGMPRPPGTAAPMHLGLNPLASAALPKFGCGACSTCSNAALINQPCLRAGLLLQTMCASSDKGANRQAHGRDLQDGVERSPIHADGSHASASQATSPARSAARQRLAQVDLKRTLQKQYRQQLEAQLLKSQQAVVVVPSKCAAQPGAWRAAASGGSRGLQRTPPSLKDSLVLRQEGELQHAMNAMQVAADAAVPTVAPQEPMMLHCDWCMGVDHTKPSCPFWQLMVEPTPAASADLEQADGPPADQDAGGQATLSSWRDNASVKRPKLAALAPCSRYSTRAAGHKRNHRAEGNAGTADDAMHHAAQEAEARAAGTDAASSLPNTAAVAGRTVKQSRLPAGAKQATRSNNGWLHVEGSLAVQSGQRGRPTQLQARAMPPPPGSDAPLTLQVRSKQTGAWQGLRVLQQQQLAVLALEQHLTLQHQQSAAPSWLQFVPASVLDSVLALRSTLAWLGRGDALTQSSNHTREPAGGGAGSQLPGAREGVAGCADDVWQSPEVCLALALLAQEQAADLAQASTH